MLRTCLSASFALLLASSALAAPAPIRRPAPAEAPPPGVLPKGYRALGVRTGAPTGGFILPGSRVDVLHTTRGPDLVTRVLLQRVLVVDVDTVEAAGGKPASVLVTLAVLPADANRLTLVASTGEVRLVLRAPEAK